MIRSSKYQKITRSLNRGTLPKEFPHWERDVPVRHVGGTVGSRDEALKCHEGGTGQASKQWKQGWCRCCCFCETLVCICLVNFTTSSTCDSFFAEILRVLATDLAPSCTLQKALSYATLGLFYFILFFLSISRSRIASHSVPDMVMFVGFEIRAWAELRLFGVEEFFTAACDCCFIFFGSSFVWVGWSWDLGARKEVLVLTGEVRWRAGVLTVLGAIEWCRLQGAGATWSDI